MFTGIVRAIGTVLEASERDGDRRFSFSLGGLGLEGLRTGASIAVNGVCLTAIEIGDDSFAADVSLETLAVTTFAGLRAGSPVNIEPSLRVGDSMDGHWVSGHVDGVARVLARRREARSTAFTIELPRDLRRYVARKGSITVDGVSLTVNAVRDADFEVNVVPHTAEVTIIGGYEVGTAVNIEVDIVARYLERFFDPTLTNGEQKKDEH